MSWRFSRVLPGLQHHAVPCQKARYRSRTEEARGSNPLTSTPKTAGHSVGRVGLATLAACCGRTAAADSSHSAPREASATTRLSSRPHTMTTERSRHLAASPGSPSNGAMLPRIRALPGRHEVDPPALPSSQDDGQVQADVSAGRVRHAPASITRFRLELSGSQSWTAPAITPTPGPSQPGGCLPPPRPPGRTQRTRERMDTGRRCRTPDTWTLSDAPTGHRTAVTWTGMWTLTSDTEHRTPDEDTDTIDEPRPPSAPPGDQAQRPRARHQPYSSRRRPRRLATMTARR